MKWLIIALREIKLGMRNPWAYSFMVLFACFTLAIVLIQSHSGLEGYTHGTGSLLNLILYLLPLMTLLLGSFAVTAEKEEGGWRLLSVYSLSGWQLLLGKYVGLCLVMFTVVGAGFGLSGLIGGILGRNFSLSLLAFFYFSSLALVFIFLGVAVLAGTLARGRWHALTISVGIWFVLVLAWPTLLIAILGFLPYPAIKPALQVLSFLNPAEMVRIFMVTRMGGGASFGPEYAGWIGWMQGPGGLAGFAGAGLAWIACTLLAGTLVWERRRYE